MKTYKTARGLNNALKKVLGEPSKATSEGTMSDGYMMFPVEKDKVYRVIKIEKGYPQKFIPYEDNSDYPKWAMEVCREFGNIIGVTKMFGFNVVYVDIALEVSE